jgi:hypothetical protein
LTAKRSARTVNFFFLDVHCVNQFFLGTQKARKDNKTQLDRQRQRNRDAKHLDLTLPSPAENLACDEALLDWCEENGGEEILRFWESPETFVVVGYANKVATEVNVSGCAQNKFRFCAAAPAAEPFCRAPAV